MIMERNIVKCIIFSIITCGIYGIYWMIKMNDEINELVGDTQATTGGMVFLFTLITCGFYSYYWFYKMGTKIDTINGVVNGNTGLIYVVLDFFGLGIIGYCLMQDNINKAVSTGFKPM